MSSLDQIRNYLVDKAPGPISKACTLDVESLLSSCWDRLAGSRDGGMAADKLSGRVEAWNGVPRC
jgi:hypothetical protein